jgi:transposase
MLEAFEGNKAETSTMLPVIKAFMTAHQLADVIVVADAGMISAANQAGIEEAGLSFILGTRIPEIPSWSRSGDASTRGRRCPTGTC